MPGRQPGTTTDFPCCTIDRLSCVLPPLPRWTRCLRFTLASAPPSAFLVVMASRHPRRHFEACSVFTHVAARMTCWPPTRPFQEVLQSIRYLLNRPLCFRLEREFRRVGLSPTDQPCLTKAHITMCASRPSREPSCTARAQCSTRRRGAQVGDIYMSLIHTCRLCAVNPFDYLNALQQRAQDVIDTPARWLPWNFREQLAGGPCAAS